MIKTQTCPSSIIIIPQSPTFVQTFLKNFQTIFKKKAKNPYNNTPTSRVHKAQRRKDTKNNEPPKTMRDRAATVSLPLRGERVTHEVDTTRCRAQSTQAMMNPAPRKMSMAMLRHSMAPRIGRIRSFAPAVKNRIITATAPSTYISAVCTNSRA